jgi:CRP-like cAMP-binding protein
VTHDIAVAAARSLSHNESTAALVKAFSHEELEQLAMAGRLILLERNDSVFFEQEPADSLYVVHAGRIGIATSRHDDREAILALMEPGDVFGEMSLLDDQPRTATARALEPSACLSVPYGPVRGLFKDNPAALLEVVRMLAGRLRVADEQIADAAFLDITGRTAKRLLEASRGRDEFHLPVTQEELAAMVGASRERVNKALSAFQRLGWLEVDGRTYRINDRAALALRAR